MILRNLRGRGSALDVGCGSGRANVILSDVFSRVVGIDRRDDRATVHDRSNAVFALGDFLVHDFGDERFDLILFIGAFYQMVPGALLRAKKWLAPEGIVVIADDCGRTKSPGLPERFGMNYDLAVLVREADMRILETVEDEEAVMRVDAIGEKPHGPAARPDLNLKPVLGEHNVCLDLLPKEAVIVDAGAALGEVADVLRAPGRRIIAVEPHTEHARFLREGGRYAEVVEAALVGEGEPKRATLIWGHELPRWGNICGLRSGCLAEKTPVDTITLRELWNRYGLDRIDFLKLDIEGSEAGLLRTFPPDLAEKTRQIAIEVHETIKPGEAIRLLGNLGYRAWSPRKSHNIYAVREEEEGNGKPSL